GGSVRLIELGAAPQTRLAGPVAAHLRTSVTGADRADWVCTLCMREAGGALINLCEGIARAGAGADEVRVDLGNICVELPAGAELALMVAGASYPRWEPLADPRRQYIHDGSSLDVHVLV